MLIILVSMAFTGLMPVNAFGTNTCTSGVADPPFLAAGVDPNLLLMIDNSGSMLDLAYVETNSECFDDTYDPTTTYAGYFQPTILYVYNLTSEKFEVWNSSTDDQWYNATGNLYYRFPLAAAVWIKIDSTPSVTGFVAYGNFLNWAAASKIDVQKEILTGGKHDATNNLLVMESRGCSNRRYLKKIQFDRYQDTGGNVVIEDNYLTLAVRSPISPTFDAWENNTAYSVGNIVNDVGELYIATTAGTSNGTGASDDTGVTWAAYTGTIWTNGASYAAGSVVSDPSKNNTLDEGTLYYTAAGGTASGTGVDDDTGITDWVPYNLTHIELFTVTSTGFDHSACQDAVDELKKTSPNQGQLKAYIDDCMGYAEGGGSSDEANSNAAFNRAIYNCWYKAKQGDWPPGEGVVTSTRNACENVYSYDDGTGTYSGPAPWNVTTDDPAYVCYGLYLPDDDDDYPEGYVGRCWNPGTAAVLTCTGGYFTGGPKAGECKQWEYVGGTDPDWDTAGYAGVDECIETAMNEYCGGVEIPEVIDPSDLADETGQFWNFPAVLVDSGVVAQMGQPLATLKGQIDQSSAPTGLIQEFTDDIRMGAMVFNDDGAKSECDDSDTHILYQCSSASNKDGGKIISGIDKSSAHTTALVNAINDIKATSWTPLAEALYNAIGYYTQNSSLRLDSSDFSISSADDPIEYYCQDNNILVITEGASTADQHTDVGTFVGTANQNDADTDDGADCGDLSGSPYLDDLTYYANNSTSLHATQLNGYDKQNITTHIVVAGTLRVTGTDECSPDVLLAEAATNGGTTLYDASDPSTLEATLREAFEAIRAGAAAGSAASVISASRGGEGAAYQAIFWPNIELSGGGTVKYIGEVHSLFVDEYGYLYEDTDGDRTLDSSDLKVIFYFNESVGASKACYGTVSSGTCTGTSKDLEEVKFLWSAAEWLANVGPTTATDASTDILANRTSLGTTTDYISNVKERFIFTWDDLDNDGIVDSAELLNFVDSATTGGTDWSALTVDASRGSVLLDFGVQTLAEADNIVKWVRGLDQSTQRGRKMPYDFDQDGTDSDVYWRLGDVIHSTPISVASPAEGFHFLYRDSSYSRFVAAYKKRRHMIYFGGNDGMIHAVNGGFYDEFNKRFCRNDSCSDEGTNPTSSPELGAELWAYVPYNLIPHLNCLTDSSYEHKYYVDQHPRVFDVRIFDPTDGIHTDGWGTILVQGMRFGGAKVRPGELDLNGDSTADFAADKREFTSSYVILDITNPEAPPVLLAEFTRKTDASHVDLSYTTPMPTIVVMADELTDGVQDNDDPEEIDTDEINWYLILGSGPTDMDGKSTQDAKVAVFPLDWLVDWQTGGVKRAFRITDALPTVASFEGGTFTLTANSFVSDMISVDFQLEEFYKTDAVYFGTVSGTWGSWGGGMYRLVTRKVTAGTQVVTKPSEWSTLLSTSGLSNPLYLLNTGQPVTGAASIGTDFENYWIYFGTGRFFDSDDKTDSGSNAQQTYYGIKEPRDCDEFTWETVEKTGSWNTTPGAQGLLQVDKILIKRATNGIDATLSCLLSDTDCEALITAGITTFNQLDTYITGTGCYDPTHTAAERALYETGKDGWYKDFSLTRERNLGQATLLGGLLTFTTYQPYNDVCLPEGLGFLYGVYFRTGTAWYESAFGDTTEENAEDVLDLGRGLAITPNLHVGEQEGSKAFVQTSTGTIVEIPQPNLPINKYKTGRTSWGELK